MNIENRTCVPPVDFSRRVNVSTKTSEKIRQTFNDVDINGDELIDWLEIQECCKKLQISLDDDDKKIYEYCDADQNGGLDVDEFVNFVHIRLKRVFDEIDEDKSGHLDETEITQVLLKLGIHISQRQIHGILRDMDQNGDGQIDFDEFCDFFADVPTLNLQVLADRWLYGEGLDIGSDSVPLAIPPAEIPIAQYMCAGATAGVVSRTVVAPLERIKIIAQTTSSQNKTNNWSVFTRILRHEGLRGLFSGNLTNCIRIAPTGAIVSLVYSRMIKYTPVDCSTNPHQPLWRLLSGATAGLISTACTHPLDVVRARLTVQDKSTSNRAYTSIYGTMKRIAAEEGYRGLFKGLSPSLLSITPFLAIQQCTYDILKLAVIDTEYGKHPITFFTCGAMAGTLGQTIIHPLDIVRRLEQIETTSTRKEDRMISGIRHTTRAVIKQLWREGGVKRCYAGLTASYLKVAPSAAISLIVRDTILGRLSEET